MRDTGAIGTIERTLAEAVVLGRASSSSHPPDFQGRAKRSPTCPLTVSGSFPRVMHGSLNFCISRFCAHGPFPISVFPARSAETPLRGHKRALTLTFKLLWMLKATSAPEAASVLGSKIQLRLTEAKLLGFKAPFSSTEPPFLRLKTTLSSTEPPLTTRKTRHLRKMACFDHQPSTLSC